MNNQNNSFSIGAVFILLLIGAMVGFHLGRWSNTQNKLPYVSPTIMLSPAEKGCTLEAKLCPDGSAVGRSGPNCEFAPCPIFRPSTVPPGSAEESCVRAGCSGELCVESSQSDINTPCVFKEEYACLSYSRCERQEDGKCGWTQTPEYSSCLNKLKNNF